MRYHCHLCGGWLEFREELIKGGRIFHCDCNRCGHKIKQISYGYFIKAKVLSNVRVI